MGLDFQKVQGHVRVRFQVEIHRALARAGLVVTITVWKPLLTLQHVHRCTSRVECGYLHRNKPLVVKPAKILRGGRCDWRYALRIRGGSASEKGT